MRPPCEIIAQQIGELFTCTVMQDYIRIRTPYLYPDGDFIDIFAHEQNGVITLTDLGETSRWLRMQTVSDKRSIKQEQLIADVCMNHSVEQFRGMLRTRVQERETLPGALTRIAQASLRVSDIVFTFRGRLVETVTDEVADFLMERQIPFQRSETLPGRSGRSWTLDFHTRMPQRSAFISVLATGSRPVARRVAEHALAQWYDLSHLKVGPEPLRFVSLFDDTSDVWTPEDFRLVEGVSDVAFWSRPDEFEQALAA